MAMLIVTGDTVYRSMSARALDILSRCGITVTTIEATNHSTGSEFTGTWIDEWSSFSASVRDFKLAVAKLPIIKQIMNPVVPRLSWIGPVRVPGLDIRRFIPRRV